MNGRSCPFAITTAYQLILDLLTSAYGLQQNPLLGKNPTVLLAAKQAVRHVQGMSWELSDEYLMAKNHQVRLLDAESGRAKGTQQFLDDRTFKPGLAGYDRTA